METLKIGDKVRFSFPWSDGSIIRFKGTVIRVDNEKGKATVAIPKRIRSMKWSPTKFRAAHVLVSINRCIESRRV